MALATGIRVVLLPGMTGSAIMEYSELAGVGILIEKSFQSGHDYIVNKGYDFYSLANITSFDDGKITFAE